MIISSRFRRLTLGASSFAMLAGLAAPALAQTVTTSNPNTPSGPSTQAIQQSNTDNTSSNTSEPSEVVVTGTLFRRTDTETPSPVSVITAQQFDQRGLTTVADAIQTISAANGGGVPQGFLGAFASGAQGVSLRGLTTNSTLVLFDGLRPAYYPLADDGQRSFVDINTIPSAIVDRIETLRDGASSTYGADAVGGVVNIILKKEITGVQGSVEAGSSERGDGGLQRVTGTVGYGKLAEQGFNFYISGEYEHQSPIFARDRGFPYNTKNLQSIGGANGDTNYLQPSVASSSSNIAATVRPANQAVAGNILSGTAITGGQYQVIQQGGCAGAGLIQHTNAAGTYCEQDLVNNYTELMPSQTRYGGTAHLTVNVGANSQAYLTATYYDSKSTQRLAPSTVRSNNPVYTYGLVLPAKLTSGALDPYDPYAASGQAALLFYMFGDIPKSLTNDDKSYRVAGGIGGKLGSNNEWNYNIAGTYMRSDLTQSRTGFINVAGLANAINTGAYNFINPSANTQAVRDSIAPFQQSKAHTEEAEVQGTVTRELFQLPGGALNLGVGGEFRYENIYDPNPNPGAAVIGVNTFQAVGHRYVTSGFFEVSAPIVDQLELDASGRYDHYSIGFDHFSPKFGGKFSPTKWLAIRGTYSEGFRAPSIPETNGNVIGFVNYTPPAATVAAHGGDSYVSTYSLGLNSIGNPNLKPETSRSFTGGAVLQPTHWLSATFDYYNIHKSNVIYNPADSTYANAYLNGGTLPAGITITPNPADPAFPNLPGTPAFVNSAYLNGQSLQTSGIDANIIATFHFGPDLKFTTNLEGTEILEYKLNTGVNGIYDYLGTLGSYNVTSASGTPRWRGTWQNTLDAGKFELTATTYFTSGYKGYAADYNGVGSCAAGATPASTYTYNADVSRTATGALQCTVRHFIDVDLNASFKVNSEFTFYVNVFNILDAHAPFDPNTYGGNNYNPAWSWSGVLGRYFKAGARFKF